MDSNEPNNPRPVELEYASRTRPPKAADAPLEPEVKKALWRMFFLGIGLLIVPLVHMVLVSGMLGKVVTHEFVEIVTIALGGLGSVYLLSLSFRLIHKRRVVKGILCLLLFLGSLVYLLICALGIAIASRPINALTGPDGKQYVLLCRSRFLDPDYALGTLKSDFGILKTYRVLAYGSPSYGSYYQLTLIRPEPMAKQTGFRFFVQNNLVCLQQEGGNLIFLYDLEKQKQIDPDQEAVSPWIFFDEQCEVHKADEENLINKNLSHGFDDHPEIVAELNHPNPNVRESARRVLGALNVAIPATQP